MKKLKFFIFCISLIPFFVVAQFSPSGAEKYLTPGGVMDTVFDRFGKKYPVSSLQISATQGQLEQGKSISTIPTCTAGMFVVYYGIGSGMENPTNPVHVTRRQTVCEVLSNLSGLLGYNSSYPNSALIRILVDDVSLYTAPVTPSASGVLGLATPFFVMPWNPASPNPGIVENLIQKTIKSKVDAWTNIITPIAPVSSNGFYHGVMAFNFANPGISWNSGISTTAGSSQYDLYTVILHEITHALGFASLIGANGISKFGPANNYYSTYDKYLKYLGTNSALLPLLTSTLGNACNASYGLTFTANPNILAPGCAANYQSDLTVCSTAIRYSSSLIPNMTVYTPACFEGPSSLSHFEDMCYPANTPSNNNQYFTMSNANGPGTNKRFLQPEEKNVLCDLGYTVTNTYTSNAASASYTYSGGTCNPPPVWGINDGLNGNTFLFTSTGGPISIPITGTAGVIANDYQGSAPVTTVSCVESVYNNGTAVVSGTTIIFTPSGTNGGIFVIRYIPKTATGLTGNITYIFGFVYPSFCGSVNPCDMVQNGGFENNSGCGSMPIGSNTLASCWLVTTLSPDIFVRNCTTGNLPANLGTNTYSSNPVFNSFNGAPNNAVMGIGAFSGQTELDLSESLANYLGAPVLNNQAYTLSFWAYQFAGDKYDPLVDDGNGNFTIQGFNTYSINAVLSFATSSLFIPASFSVSTFPYSGLTTIKSVTLANVFNVWRHYSITFTTSAINNGNWLYVGMDRNLTFTNALTVLGIYGAPGKLFYTLLDDISLRPANQAPQLNMPSQICTGQSLNDLGQYVNIAGGNFSGTGVTSTVVSTANGTVTQYNFNNTQTLPNGLYTITYTYTDNIQCIQTAIQQIKIGNILDGLQIAYATSTNCINSGTLSVASPVASYNYTWQPGNFVGTFYPVSPNSITNYTVLGSNGGTCFVSGNSWIAPNITSAQLTVYPQPVCIGNSAQIAAVGSFTSILWQPGNYTTSVIGISPTVTTTYSAIVTNTLGCPSTATTVVLVSSILPTISVSVSNSLVCAGKPTTLTVTGAWDYFWYNGVYDATMVVNPSSTTIYTVIGTATNNCANTATAMVQVYSPSITISRNGPICAGEPVTLTAQSGANTYAWFPVNAYSSVVTVTPQVTSNYMVYATILSFGNTCVGTNTVQVVVNPCTDLEREATILMDFKLYPNPNNGTFSIELQNGIETEIKIYNDSGQLVKLLNLNSINNHKVAVSDLLTGFYVVESKGKYTKLIVYK